MIITPEKHGLNELERHIAPPMRMAITIPLSIDGRRSERDGFIIYVCHGAFSGTPQEPRVLKAIASAVAAQLSVTPPFEVK